MPIPEGSPAHRLIMATAWKAFPLMHLIVHKKSDGRPDRSKTAVMKSIGTYLTRSKRTASMICEYLYGKKGSDKAVPKREREFEPADIIELFKFLRVVEGAGDGAVCEPAARTLLSTFGVIDQHFTYTLCPEHVETEQMVAEDDADDNGNENDDSGQIEGEPVNESVSIFDIS